MPNPYFRALAIANIRAARVKSQEARNLKHSGLEGRAREFLVEELFRPFLPTRCKFATGKVVDFRGTQSAETDIIIYDPSELPAMMFGARDGMIPVETVLAVIEVKTKLTTSEFKRTVSNNRKLRKLRRVDARQQSTHGRQGWQHTPTVLPRFLFAFEGPTLKTMRAWMQKYQGDGHAVLPTVSVLGRGTIRARQYEEDRTEWQWSDEHDEVIAFMQLLEAGIWNEQQSLSRDPGMVMGVYLGDADVKDWNPPSNP